MEYRTEGLTLNSLIVVPHSHSLMDRQSPCGTPDSGRHVIAFGDLRAYLPQVRDRSSSAKKQKTKNRPGVSCLVQVDRVSRTVEAE